MLRNNGMGGTRFASLRYKGRVGGLSKWANFGVK